MNSEPKLNVSQLSYFLEQTKIGALLSNKIKPVLERRVTESPALSESTKALIVKHAHLGEEIFQTLPSLSKYRLCRGRHFVSAQLYYTSR